MAIGSSLKLPWSSPALQTLPQQEVMQRRVWQHGSHVRVAGSNFLSERMGVFFKSSMTGL